VRRINIELVEVNAVELAQKRESHGRVFRRGRHPEESRLLRASEVLDGGGLSNISGVSPRMVWYPRNMRAAANEFDERRQCRL